jgi:hypothetical protein
VGVSFAWSNSKLTPTRRSTVPAELVAIPAAAEPRARVDRECDRS